MLEIFALSGLVNGIIALCLGIFIIWRNWRSKINQLYFLIIIAVCIWSFSYWRWLLSNNASDALFWVRMLSIGSTLIPVFYFHWIVSLLKANKTKRNAVIIVYLTAAIFLIFSFSDLFIKQVKEKLFFPFWPDPGLLYHFYLFFTYILLATYSIILLFKNYKISSQEQKGQIIFVIIGSIIAFGGGLTNFFLWYDIPIVPYGNFFVALFPFFFGYAILKHHLFDIKVIATELFTITIWVFLLLKTLMSETPQDLLINIILFIAVIIFGILLIRGVRKEVEQREKLEQLTKEIQRAYKVEKKANKALQQLDDVKNQFIMASQHHLRSPLTAMRGYVDLIMGGTYGKVPEKLKDPILKFQISTSRLIRIINEFLDISQFQLGKKVVMPKLNVDIEPIIKEAIEELQYETQIKKLYLKYEKPAGKMPLINADSEKLKVAMFNIIDNAIKYTKEGGITIKIQTVSNKLRIIVKDTGIGLSKEDAKTMFSKLFERGTEARRVFVTGRGIGLYITNKIIEAHNGKIWAESEGKGRGSVFIIELPIS